MCFAPHLLHRTMDARLRLALCSPNITTYESEFVASSLYSGQHRSLNNVGNSQFVGGNVRAICQQLCRWTCDDTLAFTNLWWILYLKYYSSSQTPGVLLISLGRHFRQGPVECVPRWSLLIMRPFRHLRQLHQCSGGEGKTVIITMDCPLYSQNCQQWPQYYQRCIQNHFTTPVLNIKAIHLVCP